MNFLTNLFGNPASAAEAIDVTEAERRRQAGAMLVDVRETDEWRGGHAPGAQHVPLGSLPARLSDLPSDRDVLLICRSGNRSGQVQRWLRQQGVAFKQESPRHAAHWLDEWLADGTLAGGAWAGYLRMPKDGTQRIVAAVLRENGASSKLEAPAAKAGAARLEPSS